MSKVKFTIDTTANPYVVWLYFPDGQRTILGFTDNVSSADLAAGIYQLRIQIFGPNNTKAALTIGVENQSPDYKVSGKITDGGQAVIPGGFRVWSQADD